GWSPNCMARAPLRRRSSGHDPSTLAAVGPPDPDATPGAATGPRVRDGRPVGADRRRDPRPGHHAVPDPVHRRTEPATGPRLVPVLDGLLGRLERRVVAPGARRLLRRSLRRLTG